MPHNETFARPFPSTPFPSDLVFPDVDQRTLAIEDFIDSEPFQPDAWQVFMSATLPQAHAGSEAARHA